LPGSGENASQGRAGGKKEKREDGHERMKEDEEDEGG
jgi:hypothetical protein